MHGKQINIVFLLKKNHIIVLNFSKISALSVVQHAFEI